MSDEDSKLIVESLKGLNTRLTIIIVVLMSGSSAWQNARPISE